MKCIKNKKIRIIAVYQKLLVLFMAMLIIGNTFQFEPSYYILLILSILIVFTSYRGIDINYVKQYVFIFCFALYGIIVATMTKGGYGGPLTIITGLMVLYAAQEIKFDKFDISVLVIAMLISIGYWLYRSPTYYSEFFYNQWKGDNTFTNSNGVGHYLAYQGAFMFMIMSLSQKKWIKLAKWILAGMCVWGCYNVRARMALITLLLFLLSNIFIKVAHKYKKQFVKLFLYFSVFFEICFPLIYLMLYVHGIGTNIKFFGLNEKGLYSGRESIWMATFDAIKTIPEALFGIGSKQDFWKEGLLNMHNNAMNLLVVVGLVGLATYFIYLLWYINKKFEFENASKLQWQCLIFFICILFEGASDITIFYNPFLAYYFIPLGIALSRKYIKSSKMV